MQSKDPQTEVEELAHTDGFFMGDSFIHFQQGVSLLWAFYQSIWRGDSSVAVATFTECALI